MKECKCMKCGRAFSMPDNFMGKIVCEDCDPFMNPQTSHNSDYAKCADALGELIYYNLANKKTIIEVLQEHFA